MERIPVTILSGFLGSGKTTRLNELLRAPGGRRIAVILNELGAIGVDASKLASAEEFVELDGGCLCCTLNADLEGTLHRLRARGGFDHLVIETTGVADPLAVSWTLERGGLREGYRVDAIVVVVDAATVDRALGEGHDAELQIERADVLLLSKLELATTTADALRERLRAMNPSARIVDGPRDATPWPALLDAELPETRRPVAASPAHHHGPEWETWVLHPDGIVSDEALERFLRTLPAAVFRAKGLLQTDATPPWLEVHAVGGRYEMEPITPPPAGTRSVLICIGRTLDRAALDTAAAALRLVAR